MNIYINGRFLTQKTTGVQRVAEEIVKKIDDLLVASELEKDLKVILLVPKNTMKDLKLKRIKIKKIGILKGHLWEQLILPIYTRNHMLINFCNTGPIYKKNQIVMIHDAAVCTYPEGFSKAFLLWYRFLYSKLSKSAKKIITVSNFSKRELVSYFPSMKSKIDVIYNGIDHIWERKFEESILEKHQLTSGEYILAVSSMNPNKNFKVIAEAMTNMTSLKAQVVIVGGKQSKVFANETMESDQNIIWTGYVSDEELVTLYKNAKVFLFPSIYEGFGLPPLEAMAMGCPVIASNAACIPEICGEHVTYFDPTNANDLAEKIQLFDQMKILNSKKGAQQFVKKYNWNDAAKKLLEHIKML
ncbi:glycosyltransferase family 4 protein [Bacillus mobilis]|uniref:glycosyltransferase family 4 protein n=1 Tax=Bacillus mobilis TaxID=2026190 RepID=UPI0021CED1F6|nr:glycosyltransferase family 1 protein [Bacillus mobilis]MCU5193945.1 glycosyltransferase family 4 protein [Bacillus mobilis]